MAWHGSHANAEMVLSAHGRCHNCTSPDVDPKAFVWIRALVPHGQRPQSAHFNLPLGTRRYRLKVKSVHLGCTPWLGPNGL